MVTEFDVTAHEVSLRTHDGGGRRLGFDRLGRRHGAGPVVPPATGPDQLGPDDGVHVLHTMADAMRISDHLGTGAVRRAVGLGAATSASRSSRHCGHEASRCTRWSSDPRSSPGWTQGWVRSCARRCSGTA